MEALTTAMTTALSTVASEGLGVIAAVIPIAAPVFGAGVAINLAVKFFRKVSGSGRT